MRKIIEGNVDLSDFYLTELFDLSDVEVMGYFYCAINNLTSLAGAPHTVVGDFDCSYNNLTSLRGIPKTVGVDFFISKTLKDKFPEEYIRSLCEIEGEVIYCEL